MTNAEAVELCGVLGVPIKSHSSSLNEAYADMVAYFHKWYVPNNMAIILAGDIDAETAIPVLESSQSPWSEAGPTTRRPGSRCRARMPR